MMMIFERQQQNNNASIGLGLRGKQASKCQWQINDDDDVDGIRAMA
jgi:hypothetical protein